MSLSFRRLSKWRRTIRNGPLRGRIRKSPRWWYVHARGCTRCLARLEYEPWTRHPHLRDWQRSVHWVSVAMSCPAVRRRLRLTTRVVDLGT